MKTDKIICSPVFIVLMTTVLLILGFQCINLISRRYNVENPTIIYTPGKLHNEAYELMQVKNYSEAIEKSEAAIQLDPNYIDAWVDKGIALYSMRKCEEGVAALYHAVNLDPKNENLSAMLGSMLNKCEGQAL